MDSVNLILGFSRSFDVTNSLMRVNLWREKPGWACSNLYSESASMQTTVRSVPRNWQHLGPVSWITLFVQIHFHKTWRKRRSRPSLKRKLTCAKIITGLLIWSPCFPSYMYLNPSLPNKSVTLWAHIWTLNWESTERGRDVVKFWHLLL